MKAHSLPKKDESCFDQAVDLCYDSQWKGLFREKQGGFYVVDYN
jgi:hypothetical protein